MQGVNARVVVGAVAVLGILATGVEPRAFESEEQTEYHVTELRGLGGRDSRGNSVNDWGLVAGYSNVDGNATRRAMLWFLGQKLPLGTFGGANSSVTWPGGVNNAGLVVGIAQTNEPQTRSDGWSCRGFFPPGPDNSKYTCLGFVWEAGKMKRLPAIGGDNSFAASVNNRRQVVGWAETAAADPDCINPADRGFLPVLWDLNRHRTVKLPLFDTDTAGAATAVNDRGQVAGISGVCDQSVGRHTAKHAVLWQDGKVHDLGNLGADNWITPTSISPNGEFIVGFGNSPGGDPDNPSFRAFLWTRRQDVCAKLPGSNMCDLGTLDVGGTAQAWGVNDRGQVVGTACLDVCRAFLWEKGDMKDLNGFKGSYPHRLENAMDINRWGRISGRAQAASLERFAFVATPKRTH